MTDSDSRQSCSPRPRKPPSIDISHLQISSESPKASPKSSSTQSPRNPVNTVWMQDRQRRVFLNHLKKWSLDHDSSPYFHGKISLLSTVQGCAQPVELGKSVRCILVHSLRPTVSKQIVIRLFPPRGRDARYTMVIRCGAGWMSSREFFNREYFALRHLETRKQKSRSASRPDHSQKHESKKECHIADKEAVVIHPLFRPFLSLPLELQQHILQFAAGVTGSYRPCRDSIAPLPHHGTVQVLIRDFYPKPTSNIPLGTLFKISKGLNDYLIPWIYRTTNFQFELTGFTNFLWQSGPVRRAEIRHLSFSFGQTAMLHCLRWLSPDPVFMLFQPPVPTSPRALQYFWRCQIQDYTRELHLASLTFDIHNVPAADIPFIVRILQQAFGSLQRIHFTSRGTEVPRNDKRLAGLKEPKSWREMCSAWYRKNRFSRSGVMAGGHTVSAAALELGMNLHKDFFDAVAT